MRIRVPFLAAFFALLLAAAYAGLTTIQIPGVNDKALHFLTFLLLTLLFYWILDTTRRRNLNLTLVTCTAGLGVGSEFLQAALPNGRVFDVYDIVANIAGSLSAVGACAWYHKRMLERKRKARGYGALGQGDAAGIDDDVELGDSPGVLGDQESGVVPSHVAPITTPTTNASLESELDEWDENQVDDEWDESERLEGTEGGLHTPSASSGGEDAKIEVLGKRTD